jgi:hypothetical protein
MIRLGVFLVALLCAFGAAAKAQEGYPSSCDPGKQFECAHLAMKYRGGSFGTPTFPNDAERADALVRMALDGAHKGCAGTNFSQCYTLAQLETRLSDVPTSGPYSQSGRMRAYLEYTETGCGNGDAEACYWRAAAFPRYDLERHDVGVALFMADGMSKAAAMQKIQDTGQAFKRKILPTARAQVATLRPLCAAKQPKACATLGEVLKDNEGARNTPFEHIRFLFEACDIKSPKACRSLDGAIGRLGVTKPSRAVEAPIKATWIAALQNSCADGKAAHCQILVDLARGSKTLDKDALQKTACSAGAAQSCASLARSRLLDYDATGDAKDLQSATDLLTRACELKDNAACHKQEHLSKS